MSKNSDNLGGMDTQHKQPGELAEAARHSLKNVEDVNGAGELSEILRRLLEDANNHFFEEENLMRRYGYEGLELHKRSHRILLNRFAELEEETFNNFSESTKARLLNFLEREFCSHITADEHAWKTGQIEKRFAYERLYYREAETT